MNSRNKYAQLSDAYETMEKGNQTIHIINKKIDQEVQDALLNIQQKLDIGFELSYEVMADATQELWNIPFEDLEKADFSETECASVYTATRLSYLDINNQQEISDIATEYACDIQAACAVWYDRQVANACELLRDYIL